MNMETLVQDLRFGLRMLLKSPGFTLAAILALALGIGANTAIFSVVNAVLLRPLPYKDAERIVMVWEGKPDKGWDQFAVSPANYLDWVAQSRSLESMVAFRTSPLIATGGNEPERLRGALATREYFDLVGIKPSLGRVFLETEYEPGKGHAVILSDALYKRRFGGRPDVLGTTVMLNAEPVTIIGVMPQGFRLPSGADALMPLAFSAQETQARGSHYLVAMARLAPGASLESASAEMSALAARLEKEHPDTNAGWIIKLVPLYEQVVGDVRPALWALFGAVGCVLLVACANVANLLLARSASRRGEIAVRAALGAGRLRLVRQLLTESLLLALLGGGLGLLLGMWSVDLLRALQPGNLPRLDSLSIDRTVMLFTFLASALTGLLFGLLPALALSRSHLHGALQEAGRGVRTRMSQGVRGMLVVAQVAISLVLLAGAGLHLRSIQRLMQVNPGFDPESLLTMRASLPGQKYPKDEQQTAFYDRVLDSLKVLPGVEVAAAVSPLPQSDNDLIYSVSVEGRPPSKPGEGASANWYTVSPTYFTAMRIPLLKGRLFTDADAAGAPRVALINETMARKMWPGEDPLGQRLRMGIDSDAPREIVGVVGDVRHYGLDQDVTMQMYDPVRQRPMSGMSFVLKTSVDPASLAPAARRAVLAADPEQPVSDVRTMREVVEATTAQRRFSLLLLGVFAGIALLLAAVGIYGVVGYSVAQRTHEIGVRMALGARRGEILGLVLRQGMALALLGVGVGLVGALALTRLIAGLLFGVSASDPLTFAATAVLLSGVALLATFIPAHRATRVEPTAALRYE
jgi:putative ABC transport system permease protein